MYSFSYLEPVCCSMSSSNCCFLTCIQTSQEAGQVVWYSHLLENSPQFVVIHTVKGFDVISKVKVDVFLVFCFFDDPVDVGSLISIDWGMPLETLPLLYFKMWAVFEVNSCQHKASWAPVKLHCSWSWHQRLVRWMWSSAPVISVTNTLAEK